MRHTASNRIQCKADASGRTAANAIGNWWLGSWWRVTPPAVPVDIV